jgi:hypothetical protein
MIGAFNLRSDNLLSDEVAPLQRANNKKARNVMFRAFNVFIFRRVFILPRPAGGFWRIVQ